MSEEEPRFRVFVWGMLPASPEDWGQALRAPSSELEGLLTEDDKAFARKFGFAEKDYARSRLLHSYGEKRMKERGAKLGRTVEEILAHLGAGYELKAVISEMMKERWVVRIQTPTQTVNVAIDRGLADDVVDSETIQDLDRLRELLETSLQRSEQIGKR